MFLKLIFVFYLFPVGFFSLDAFCDPKNDPPLSPRLANYHIQLTLDRDKKSAEAVQKIQWVNSSPNSLSELRLYMYLNAFKNEKSTFLKDGRFFFGEDITKRKAEEWGWIEISSIKDQNGIDLTANINYIQPDDGNEEDQTVLQIPLANELLSGDTIILAINYISKLPKTFVRSGYSRDDFFLFVHWFPQMGVYEKNEMGDWIWNCHQFHSRTEFYSDFGTYDVEITADDDFIIGATGCLMSETENDNGTISYRYYAEDVIDFAWTAYPHFEVYRDFWDDIEIELLIPPEHASLRKRYFKAIKQCLEFLSYNVGKYPYPKITIIDPPVHAFRSGLMEYPMLITCASFAYMPSGIRTLESLVVHEFTHQFFMAVVATNEKEEAWLDEGFVTYYEDKIMDYYYGSGRSLFNILGIRIGNNQLTRAEYVGLPDPQVGIIAKPGWEFGGEYKGIVYSKTAMVLRTLEGMIGEDVMVKIMKSYYSEWKFKHPKGKDFIEIANRVVGEEYGDRFGENLNWFFNQCIYDVVICDYEISEITNTAVDQSELILLGDQACVSIVSVKRNGELIVPVEIEISFDDGSKTFEYWNAKEVQIDICYEGSKQVVSAHIDPDIKNPLDINIINNSKTAEASPVPKIKYSLKSLFWVQNLLQSFGSLL